MSTASIICLALAATWILLLAGICWFIHRYEEFVHEVESTSRLLRMRSDADGIDLFGYPEDDR